MCHTEPLSCSVLSQLSRSRFFTPHYSTLFSKWPPRCLLSSSSSVSKLCPCVFDYIFVVEVEAKHAFASECEGNRTAPTIGTRASCHRTTALDYHCEAVCTCTRLATVVVDDVVELKIADFILPVSSAPQSTLTSHRFCLD